MLLESLNTSLFLDCDPQILAEQFCLFDFTLFQSIKVSSIHNILIFQPAELLSQSWNREGKEENSPNVLNMIQRFNEVALWVYSSFPLKITSKGGNYDIGS
jgi:hypothetical protein